MASTAATHAARLTIDYPDRSLDRLSTALRLLYILPILIVLGLIAAPPPGTRRVRPEPGWASSARACWAARSC